MGLLIIIFILTCLICWGIVGDNVNNAGSWLSAFRKCKGSMTVTFVLMGVLYGAIVLLIYMLSFDSYSRSRAQYDRVVAQYGQAVVIYQNKATIDVKKVGDTFTDLRFQGYQEKMSEFIADLRKTVTEYNNTIITKKVWSRNFMVGGYIVQTDPDMKLIDMINTVPENLENTKVPK